MSGEKTSAERGGRKEKTLWKGIRMFDKERNEFGNVEKHNGEQAINQSALRNTKSPARLTASALQLAE